MTGGKGRICLAMLILALVFGVLWYLLAQGKSRPECGGTLVKYIAEREVMT